MVPLLDVSFIADIMLPKGIRLKYDGIATEVLLAKNDKVLLIALTSFLFEGASYLLYKHVDKHPAIGVLAILFSTAAIGFAIILTGSITLPLRLKYIHGRKDIPEDTLDITYWCAFGRAIPAILGLLGHSIRTIWKITHGG